MLRQAYVNIATQAAATVIAPAMTLSSAERNHGSELFNRQVITQPITSRQPCTALHPLPSVVRRANISILSPNRRSSAHALPNVDQLHGAKVRVQGHVMRQEAKSLRSSNFMLYYRLKNRLWVRDAEIECY